MRLFEDVRIKVRNVHSGVRHPSSETATSSYRTRRTSSKRAFPEAQHVVRCATNADLVIIKPPYTPRAANGKPLRQPQNQSTSSASARPLAKTRSADYSAHAAGGPRWRSGAPSKRVVGKPFFSVIGGLTYYLISFSIPELRMDLAINRINLLHTVPWQMPEWTIKVWIHWSMALRKSRL